VVDTVLYFEGERHHAHRVVRAVKNRFGAANELGVFEMTAGGLEPVANPSGLFLSERPADAAGSAVLCAVEGSRPILVEVQALVSTSSYGYAKRTANGLDANRLALLLAVLEKRAGLNLAGEDVFVNVAGGVSVEEPAADVAVVAALASSVRNRPLAGGLATFGEIGLGGEVRRATQAGLRVREAVRMGFTSVLAPDGSVAPSDVPDECRLVGVRTLAELLDALFD
jgi:DNA repair protein RadA/Sms